MIRSVTKDVREFSEFKWEALAAVSTDIHGVHEILYMANSWYPELLASERLAIAERFVREVAAEGFADLVSGGLSRSPAPITRREHDSVLRDWTTWSPPYGQGDARAVFVTITDAGEHALTATHSTHRLP